MIYETINELGSAIINYRNNDIEMIGFFSPEMLEMGLTNNYSNKMSHGIYPLIEFNLTFIKDNFTLIIQKNGVFYDKYNFKTVLKDSISYKNKNNLQKNNIYCIRKCIFHEELFNLKFAENSLTFNSLNTLKKYFSNTFALDLFL